jgi:uncharacterized protein YlxP (DUF503 family)
MIAVVVVFECRLPGAHSLKEKRRVIRSLIERIHRRHRVSIIESDFHDVHQRAELAIAAVQRDGRSMQKMLDAIRAQVDREHDAEVVTWDAEVLEERS